MLTSAVAAHGFSHRHAGGDESHSHRAHATVDGGHSHDHDDCRHHSHVPPEQAIEHEPDVLAGSELHAHLWILGFDLSLPPSDGSEHQDQDTEFVTLLGQGNMPFPVVTRHLPAFELLLLQLNAVALTGDVPIDTFDRIGHAQVSTPPLCDCARFERSGVLLI